MATLSQFFLINKDQFFEIKIEFRRRVENALSRNAGSTIGYWSTVDSLEWDVESILELDYEGSGTPMGLNGLQSKLIFLDSTVYKGLGF